jgi:superoxide dismutase, Fe-Mn family
MKKIEERIQQIEKTLTETHIETEKQLLITEMKKIGIEKLPYSYSALKNFIDAETMNFHYNKHYKGYVDKLNAALSKKKHGDLDLEKIIKNISRYDQTVRNNAGGAFNHALFWNMLTPTPKKLTGDLYQKIAKQYGSFNLFKKKFETVAKDRFGSGWVWLVLTKKNTLKIMSTSNQDNPLMNVIDGGGFPLLGLDLWEHAYYLKYRNKRDEYITNFWKVVNWDFVNKLYEMKTKTKLIESTDIRNVLGQDIKPKFCSPDESQLFRSIRENPKVKSIYQNELDRILKDRFSDFFRGAQQDEVSGFYGYEKEGARSVLSNINSNNAVFCLFVKAVNNQIDKLGQPEKKFNFWKKEKRTVNEIKRFLRAIDYFKDEIFNPSNEEFVNIVRVLLVLWERGIKTEDETIKKLENYFEGDAVFTKTSGHGLKTDIKGIDTVIELGGKKLNAQIKPYTSTEVYDNKIKIDSKSSGGEYKNVDWLIFYHPKQKNILIFTNDPINADVNFIFNKDSLIHEIE